MARVELPVEVVPAYRAGSGLFAPTWTTVTTEMASDGAAFVAHRLVHLWIMNDSAVATGTILILGTASSELSRSENELLDVPADSVPVVVPVPADGFRNPSDGMVEIGFVAGADGSVRLALIRMA